VDSSAPPDAAPETSVQLRHWGRAASIGAVLILLIASISVVAIRYSRRQPAAVGAGVAAAPPRGIAVLPFENLGAAEQAYFAAGVTEEVTLQLAKVSALRVMSRNAVARFKDPAAQLTEMSRELGIGAVLTGTVRHSGPQVRVAVQLIAVPGGDTIWTEQYDRTLANIFDVQSDIAVRVVRALRASLAPAEQARIERAPTENTAAYELYLQQRRLSRGVPVQNEQGITLLRKAIELDGAFAVAHAELGQRLLFKSYLTGQEDALRAMEAARAAIANDPQLARGHHILGVAQANAGRPDEGRLAMQRALELDSNFWAAMVDLALLEVNAGRLDQAVTVGMRAWPLAPNVPNSYYHLSLSLIFLDEGIAERWLRAAAARFRLDDRGDGHRVPMMLAVLEMRRGNLAAADKHLREVVAAFPALSEPRVLLTELATYAGSSDATALADEAVQKWPLAHGWWLPYTARTLRAFLHVRAGEPERARVLLDQVLATNRKLIDEGDRSSAPWHENAAVHAMRGDRAAAVEAFERAVDAGLREVALEKFDPLLASLRAEPRFVAAIRRIERDVTQMRKRVDLSPIETWVQQGAPSDAVR